MELPDDVRRWPDDPFELLGVVPPASEQDLKRAYTRLIRRYKPEHHPDEFRRIREAYEIALRHIRWYGFIPPVDTSDTAPETPTTPHQELSGGPPPRPQPGASPPPDEETSSPSESVPQSAVVHPVDDPAGQAWEVAVAGEHSRAYLRLIELDCDECSPEIALRLYWLLAIDPGLDENRTRHDWLAVALVRSSLQGPSFELYRRELAALPHDALSGPYSELLSTPGASPDALLAVGRERLAAAGLGGQWARMDDDLRALAARSDEFNEVAWLWYLVEVLSYASFHAQGSVHKRCSDLLGGLRHLELSQTWAFDKIDEVRAVGRLWHMATPIPLPLRELIRSAWPSSSRFRQRGLVLAASWAAEDPAHALYELDQVVNQPPFAPLLGVLARILQDLPSAETEDHAPRVIRGLVAAFLKFGIRKDYLAMRPDLIRYLVEERINPRDLVRSCALAATYMTRSLTDFVREDTVLWLVWQTAAAMDH